MSAKLRPECLFGNVPIALVLRSAKESLFKKLFEWAKIEDNGMEKLISATQRNWIDLHEKPDLPKV